MLYLDKPVPNAKVTSPFGDRIHPVTGTQSFHNGADYGAFEGTKIFAPAGGTVKSIYSNSAGGNQLLIEHSGGWVTGYAHLSNYALDLKVGDQVKRGELIGFVGSTGAVTGPHLHFTLTNPKGEKIDPEKYFSDQKKNNVDSDFGISGSDRATLMDIRTEVQTILNKIDKLLTK